ncbi:MAG: phage portal protein, partial [Clostridia bacterium]|nr:phage portal protein [Clostridia bacterium]
MSALDNLIGMFSPGWKAERLKSRLMIQAYEAVIPTRTHRAKRENRSANQLTQFGGRSLREQARWLDCNHDLVIGLLDKLEERIVGAKGIIVEPQPLMSNGGIATDLATQIRAKWAEWSVSPDVTGQFTRPVLERLMCRTWLRDGEVFAQLVSGTGNGLSPVADIPFWIEALEPDFVPMERTEPGQKLCQGIYLNDWGRPTRYMVYKNLPAEGMRQGDTKDIQAENMLHLKFMRRLHQIRGNSLLAGVLMRLSALKEYEDAELTAARIAAALGMFIKKGDGQTYDEGRSPSIFREQSTLPRYPPTNWPHTLKAHRDRPWPHFHPVPDSERTQWGESRWGIPHPFSVFPIHGRSDLALRRPAVRFGWLPIPV